MQIEELIDEAFLENKTLEYKGIITEGDNAEVGWLKTLVAFANTSGGTMIIGIEDKTHKIVSLDQHTADKVILMIHRLVKERIDPAIDYNISSTVIRETSAPRYILSIEVRQNRNLPVALHNEGMLGIYVRNFGRTDLATQEQIRDLVLMSDNTPYDEPFTDELFCESDFTKLYSLASEKGTALTEKALISKGAVSQDKKISRGALFFCDKCSDQRTKVSVTQWPGLNKGSSTVLASEVYIGNLLEIIEKSVNFVKNHSVNGYKKESLGRTDWFSFPARSVTEGIVNAVGHRNYYIQGSQIEINIFKDRLEITSPGSLLGVRELHKEKNISAIIPRRRNEVICALLEMCRYMEEKGSGFDKIEEDYREYGENYKPYVSSDASSFTLTLPDLTYSADLLGYNAELPNVYALKALSGKNDEKILSFCYHRWRSIREIAEYLGIEPSTYFRKQVISRLLAGGLLFEANEEKAAKYRSNPELVKVKI